MSRFMARIFALIGLDFLAADWRKSAIMLIAIACFELCALPVCAFPEKIIWTEYNGQGFDGKLQHAHGTGSGIEMLVNTVNAVPWSIALDLSDGKMYWAESVSNKIRRANLNGSGIEDIIVSDLNFPSGIALDLSNRKIYWLEYQGGTIKRAGMSGINIETIIPAADPPIRFRGFALDSSAGKIYWGEPGQIKRCNLDGTGVELISINPSPIGITSLAIESNAGKLYWSEHNEPIRRIRRTNLDGSNAEILISGNPLDRPRDIAFDQPFGKMYWGDGHWIRRANMDGSDIEEVVFQDSVIETLGIALVLCGGQECCHDTDCNTDDNSCTQGLCEKGTCRTQVVCGACCHGVSGFCNDQANPSDCADASDSYFGGLSCADLSVSCDPLLGACCRDDVGEPSGIRECSESSLPECQCTSCFWHKSQTCEEVVTNGSCMEDFSPIPTTTDWGVVILALLFAILAKISFGRRSSRVGGL